MDINVKIDKVLPKLLGSERQANFISIFMVV